MKPEYPKKLHCYVTKEKNQWIACCLDFTLAAQAETADEALDKLINIIVDYINYALNEVSEQEGRELLERKAPRLEWIKYQLFGLIYHIRFIDKLITKVADFQPHDLLSNKILQAHK